MINFVYLCWWKIRGGVYFENSSSLHLGHAWSWNLLSLWKDSSITKPSNKTPLLWRCKICVLILTFNTRCDSRIHSWRQIDGLSHGWMHPCNSLTSMHTGIFPYSLEDQRHRLDLLCHHWLWNLLTGQQNLPIEVAPSHCLQGKKGEPPMQYARR